MKIINEFLVNDIRASISFYENIFDFSIQETVGEPVEWVKMVNAREELMLYSYESATKEFNNLPSKVCSSNLIMFKYETNEEIQKIYKKVIEQKVKVFSELKETDYGTKELGVIDPDNNIIIVSS